MALISTKRSLSTMSPDSDDSAEEHVSIDLDVEKHAQRNGSINTVNTVASTAGGRRLSRVDRSIEEADNDSEIGVDAQIALEKENSIKYRTCSWQKVRLRCSVVADTTNLQARFQALCTSFHLF